MPRFSADIRRKKMTDSQRPTVLVVDDNRQFIDMVSGWLSGEYDVLTAYSGTQAIATIDRSVDVVLLDRRMPGMSGDDVLRELRDQGHDVIIAFLTSVEPTTEIIDLPVETYILKPVPRAELRESVEELVRQRSYHQQVRKLYAVAQKRAILESTSNQEVLSMNDDYITLREEEERLSERLADMTSGFSDADFIRSFRIASTGGL